MSESIPRRAFVGTVSNMLGQAVVVACSLALVPIVVHNVGATDYGTWILVDAVVSFVFLVDAGISAGLVKYVAEYNARGEHEEGARMVATALWFYAVVGVVIVVVGCALAIALPSVSSLEGHTRAVLPGIIALAALSAGISIPAIAPVAVLQGLQRFGTVNAIAAAGALLALGGTVVALGLDTGIVGVVAANALSSAVTFTAALVAVRRIAPELTRAGLRGDRRHARRLFVFSLPIAAIQVAGRLQTRTDAIVIGAALPVRLVTAYNLGQRLAEGTRLVAEQFAKVLLPIATSSGGATRDMAALRTLYLTATRITLALALSVAVPLAILGDSVLALWVGERFRQYGDVVALLALSAAVDLAMYPAAAVLQSIERHPPLAAMALGGAVVNVGLSIALVSPLGVSGVAAATLTATTGECLLLVLPYTARTLGVRLRDIARHVVIRLTVPVGVLLAILLVAQDRVAMTSFAQLAGVIAVAIGGYVLAYVLIAAGNGERAAYRSAARAGLAFVRRPLREPRRAP